jgi:hypothetical protein
MSRASPVGSAGLGVSPFSDCSRSCYRELRELLEAAGLSESAAADAAERAGLKALTARGAELERDFPFALVGQLFAPAIRRAREAGRRGPTPPAASSSALWSASSSTSRSRSPGVVRGHRSLPSFGLGSILGSDSVASQQLRGEDRRHEVHVPSPVPAPRRSHRRSSPGRLTRNTCRRSSHYRAVGSCEGSAASADVVPVTSNRLTLHIESRPDAERIAGRLCDGCGEEHRFSGWLGLLTLLEQARRETVAAGPALPKGREDERRQGHETADQAQAVRGGP